MADPLSPNEIAAWNELIAKLELRALPSDEVPAMQRGVGSSLGRDPRSGFLRDFARTLLALIQKPAAVAQDESIRQVLAALPHASPLEAAALAYVRGHDGYSKACNAYRAYVGRDDLDQRTPEELAWWEQNVLPAMQASWLPDSEFFRLARETIAAQDAAAAADPEDHTDAEEADWLGETELTEESAS